MTFGERLGSTPTSSVGRRRAELVEAGDPVVGGGKISGLVGELRVRCRA